MNNISDTVANVVFVDEAVAAAAAIASVPIVEVEAEAYSAPKESESVAILYGNANPKKRGRPPGKTNKNTISGFLPILQQRSVPQDVVTPRTVPDEVSTIPAADPIPATTTTASIENQVVDGAASSAPSEANLQELEGLNWEQFFYQLFVYKSSRMRSIPIPLDYTVVIENNKLCRLGAWVDKIRTEYETHGPTSLPSLVESGEDPETKLSVIQLSEDRIKALNALGFTWSRISHNASTGLASRTIIRDRRPKKHLETLILGGTDGTGGTTANVSIVDGEKRMNKDAIWDEMYQRLVLYHARYGYCHIPPNFDEKTLQDETTASFLLTRDMSLRSWVARQRSLFKGTAIAHGKPYVLKPERRALLAALGFDQYVAAGLQNADSSTGSVDATVKAETPSAEESNIVSGTDDLDGVSSLPPPTLPAALGGFKMRFRKNWNEYYEDLKEYKNKYHDCNVPQFWSTDRKLGKWVAKQRYQYNLKMRNEKSQLTDTRMLLLDQIGFNWGGIRVGLRIEAEAVTAEESDIDAIDANAKGTEDLASQEHVEMSAPASHQEGTNEMVVDVTMHV